MAAIQLDFFEPLPTETDMLRAEIKELRESMHKVRKGIYAKHGALNKEFLDLSDRLEIIERNICKGIK